MSKTIVAIALAFTVLIGCKEETKDKPAALPEKPAIQAVEENAVVEKSENEENVIFSTKDLDWENGAKRLSPEEYPLKIITYDGKGPYDTEDGEMIIKLPDYRGFEIVIWTTSGGDDDPYSLAVVKEKIIKLDSATSLSITPHWSEPGNEENNYCRKTFKIYKDYTIEINTDEKLEERHDNEAKKYTKYYRINDKGEFYEVR